MTPFNSILSLSEMVRATIQASVENGNPIPSGPMGPVHLLKIIWSSGRNLQILLRSQITLQKINS
jgi:hypothetical protein